MWIKSLKINCPQEAWSGFRHNKEQGEERGRGTRDLHENHQQEPSITALRLSEGVE